MLAFGSGSFMFYLLLLYDWPEMLEEEDGGDGALEPGGGRGGGTIWVFCYKDEDDPTDELLFTFTREGALLLSPADWLKNYKCFIVVSWPANLVWGFAWFLRSYTKQFPYTPPATKICPLECKPTQLKGSSAEIFFTCLHQTPFTFFPECQRKSMFSSLKLWRGGQACSCWWKERSLNLWLQDCLMWSRMACLFH